MLSQDNDTRLLLLIRFILFTLKGYWLRDNKNTLKKSRLLPDPVKRTVGEIEAGGGDPS